MPSETELLTTGRPGGLFGQAYGKSPICPALLEELNAPYKNTGGLIPEILLHTRYQVGWTWQKFHLRDERVTPSIQIADVPVPVAGNTYRAVAANAAIRWYDMDELFLVSEQELRTETGTDGILSAAFERRLFSDRTTGIQIRTWPLIEALYPETEQVKYLPEDRYQISLASVSGRVFAILAPPYIFHEGDARLLPDLPIFVLDLAEPSLAECRFET